MATLTGIPIPSPSDLYSVVIEKLMSLFTCVRDCIYPVGSIYMSTRSTNPSQFIGGTWQAITDRYLVGAGTNHKVGTLGGTSVHHHRLPVGWDNANGLYAYNKDGDRLPKFGSETIERGNSFTWRVEGYNSQNWLRIANDEEVNHEPPYLAVYMWERTA